MLRRLFKNFEQRIGSFFHERAGGEDIERALRLGGAAIHARDDGAHLSELDEELRRIRRDDQQVRVRLDEDAGVLLVCIAHFLACSHGFREAFVEGERGTDALAVGADTAGIRKAVGGDGREAVGGLGEKHGERVLAGAS